MAGQEDINTVKPADQFGLTYPKFTYARNYLMTAEEWHSTIEKCQNLLKVGTTCDKCYGALAEAYIWEQNFTEAREAIGKAIELADAETHAEWLATQACIESADSCVNNQHAMELLHQALNHDGCSHKKSKELKTFINLELADLHMIRGETNAALSHLSNSDVYIRDESFPPRLKAYGAYISARVGLRSNPFELIKRYESLLVTLRNTPFKALEIKILYHLGQENLCLGRSWTALSHFEKFLDLNKPPLLMYQGFTYGSMGAIFHTMGDLRKARLFWEKAHAIFLDYFDSDHGLVLNVIEWIRRVDFEA